MGPTFRLTFPSLVLIATGCLSNPDRPSEDDAGTSDDGSGPQAERIAPRDAPPAPDLPIAADRPDDADPGRLDGPGPGPAEVGREVGGDLPPCPAPPAGCTAPGTFCSGATALATCARDPQGCLFVSGTMPCPAGEACKGMLPNGACGCENTCNATQVGTFCVDMRTVATCTASGGCYYSSGAMRCVGVRTCQGTAGRAACQCPAAAMAAGGGCATAGATGCGGSQILRCAMDPGGSGCLIWTMTSDCAAAQGGPLVCGTKSGAPACQCPDPTGMDLHVDPVAGSDAAGGIFPSGAMMPAGCRFRTLGRGLASVRAAGARVVAITAQPPGTFSGETLPLTVPTGVTLTTADANPTPANYVIAAGGSMASSVVALGAGGAIRGFTIEGGALGIAINNMVATAATITGTTVRGSASDGLRLSAGAVTSNGSRFDMNGRDGIRVDSGTFTGTGGGASDNAGDGLSAYAGGTATLHQATLATNRLRGIYVNGGTATVDDGSVIRMNGFGGSAGIRVNGGSLTLGGASGGMVDIVDNNSDGLRAIGPAATLTVTRTAIHGSTEWGLQVDITGGTVTVTDSDIHANATGGVWVRRAPSAGATNAVTLDNVRVHTNGSTGLSGIGVWLAGDQGDVTATLKGSTIRNNRDVGLLVEQGGSSITREAIDGNDIHSNNTGIVRTTGGVLFSTPSTLTSFSANKVHGNNTDEMAFGDRPNGGGDTWILRPASQMCDAQANQIYCYTQTMGSTSVGLRILSTAPVGTKVDARNFGWTNAAPMRGRDFEHPDPPIVNDVITAPTCAAIATCP